MDLSFTSEIVLENERALVRPLQYEDWENLLPVATSDRKLVQYSTMLIYTEDLLKQHIRDMLAECEANTRYPFVIYDKLKKQYAGSSSFLFISNKDQALEIGSTWIGREFQQTGLNRNCKYLLLQYIFDTLEFERVQFKTDERNAASRAAIEKLGAKFEGILRNHILMPDGFRRSSVCYSILRNEWDEMKNTFLTA